MNTRGKVATVLYEYIDKLGKIDENSVESLITDLFGLFNIEEKDYKLYSAAWDKMEKFLDKYKK